MPSSKREWVLTQNAFDQLLTHLDSDREQAAERYEDLRQMLITFFEFRGSLRPEEQADETINRVARRMSEGLEINASTIETYAYAVARNIWREYIAEAHRVVSPLDESLLSKHSHQSPSQLKVQAERDELERRLDCLERCMQGLPSKQRELITNYYQGEREVKIKNRRELAEALGIPLNALRIRVSRLRDQIEGCVNNCLEKSTAE